jgi:phosphatidylglycerophosphate synthase
MNDATRGRVVSGTAVRDGALAVVAAVVLCGALAAYVGLSTASLAGAVVGVGAVAAAAASVVARPGRWSGPADRVTRARAALMGGAATLASAMLTGALAEREWLLLGVVVPALMLDAVDGKVARRTGTASSAGGRLDGEMDAALLMVLSVAGVRALGWWVLGIGLMRYAFFAAGYLRPQLRGTLEFRQWRRVVAAVQGITFAVALAPVVPLSVARSAIALALLLLAVSFGRDVLDLERRVRV